MNNLIETVKARVEGLKIEIHALTIAYRDPRTPWTAKAWALLVVAYAVSPIDLIPDFIPVLGYLDDLLLLPLGIALAIKLIPSEVMDEARQTATLRHGYATQGKTQSTGSEAGWLGAGMVGLAWLLVLTLAAAAAIQYFK